MNIWNYTGTGGEVFHRNRGEQPDERAENRSAVFLIKTERGAPCCIGL